MVARRLSRKNQCRRVRSSSSVTSDRRLQLIRSLKFVPARQAVVDPLSRLPTELTRMLVGATISRAPPLLKETGFELRNTGRPEPVPAASADKSVKDHRSEERRVGKEGRTRGT